MMDSDITQCLIGPAPPRRARCPPPPAAEPPPARPSCQVATSIFGRARASLPRDDLRPALALFAEAPRLPPAAIEMLASDCGDAATLPFALGALRDIVLSREADDEAGAGRAALDAVLALAVDDDEGTRAAAIRMTASRLFAHARLAPRVEAFAAAELDGAVTAEDDAGVRRRLLLYMALCPRRPQLLGRPLALYGGATAAAQESILKQLSLLMPHVPADFHAEPLVSLIEGAPPESTPAAQRMVQVVAELGSPPPALLAGLLRLVRARTHDARALAPLLPYLSSSQTVEALPELLRLPSASLKQALALLMHASPPPLPPTQLLLALHSIDLEAEGLALKSAIDGVQACIAERSVFTQTEVAAALQQLVDADPIPLLAMRTLIQGILYHPKLAEFAAGTLLRRLAQRRIWEKERLWVGFLKACHVGAPHSFGVLLSLPKPQLLQALDAHADLKQGLTVHAATNLSSIAPDALEALGLTEDD